jgi:hypothetical protein
MKKCAVFLFLLSLSFSLRADSLDVMHKIDSSRNYDNELLKSKILTVSGGVLFGGSYGVALLAAVILAFSPYETDHRVSRVLWIPLAGPIAADCVDGINEPLFSLVCAGWSAAELAGAVLLASGIKCKITIKHKKYSLLFHPELIQNRYPGIGLSINL